MSSAGIGVALLLLLAAGRQSGALKCYNCQYQTGDKGSFCNIPFDENQAAEDCNANVTACGILIGRGIGVEVVKRFCVLDDDVVNASTRQFGLNYVYYKTCDEDKCNGKDGAIRCQQCDSVTGVSDWCADTFDAGNIPGPCPAPATQCGKFKAVVDNVNIVQRFCMEENSCETRKQRYNATDEFCEACSSDGCNKSHGLAAPSAVFLTLAVLLGVGFADQ